MSGDPIRHRARKRRLRVAAAVLAVGVLALWIQREFRPINRTIRALQSRDSAARLAAAEALSRALPDDAPATIPALADALGDMDGRVSVAAVESLAAVGGGTMRDPDARGSGLLAAWGPAGSADRREGAMAVLPAFETRLGQAIPLLVEDLSNRDPGRRYRAAGVLGGAGPAARAAVPALIAVLEEPFIPRPAAPATSQAGRPPVEVPPGRWDPACEAARALGRIARRAGASVADEAVAALAGTLRSEHFWRRNAAAEGLFFVGKGAAAASPALASALAESVGDEGDGSGPNSWAARVLGLTAPGTASEPEAIAALTRALDSSHRGTRIWSVDSLARFGPPASSALPRLRALRDDRDRFVAAKATSAVARIEGTTVPARRTDHSR